MGGGIRIFTVPSPELIEVKLQCKREIAVNAFTQIYLVYTRSHWCKREIALVSINLGFVWV